MPLLATVCHCLPLLATECHCLPSSSGGRPLNDFFVLHAPGMFWTEPTPNGVTPTARVGHAAALVGTKVFIFGGHDGKTCLNDVHVLVTMNWATLGAKGGRPSPRVSPTLTTVGHKLVMLGGAAHDKALNDVRIYNVEAAAWTVPTVGGTPPLALLEPCMQVLTTAPFPKGGRHAAPRVVRPFGHARRHRALRLRWLGWETRRERSAHL